MQIPQTKKENVVDEINGISVADPYRWLEDDNDENVNKWVADQNEYTNSFLRNNQQEKFLAELSEDFAIVNFSNPLLIKGRYFFTERQPNEDHVVLYVKNGLDGTPKKLIDPNLLSKSGTISLDYWRPGRTGNYVAYGLSEGGDEMSTLRIMDVNNVEDLQEKIINCSYSSIQWLPDDSGFFYTRNPRPGTVPKGEGRLHIKVYFHKIGDNPDNDKLIFGSGRPKEDKIQILSSADGRYLAIHVSHTWSDNEIYVYDREHDKITPLVVSIPAKFSLRFLNDKVILFTNYRANNYRVLSTSLDSLFVPIDEWEELVPESKNILASVSVARDRILLEYQKGACSEVVMIDYSGREIGKIPLPDYSHVTMITSTRAEEEFFYSVVTFTSPRIIYRFNPGKQEFETYKTADNPIDPSQYTIKQEWCVSKDGTKVPMFVLHKKDLLMNGINPTILIGYGGFGSVEAPDFHRDFVPWIRRGGVLVIANIRGGGEFGEEWHKAGIKENKQNSFDDFISTAGHLISKKYTDTEHLGIIGTSNGGMLVSAVAVQRPDLFKAVCARVPITDMARFSKFGIAARWIHEYGDPNVPADLQRILTWSPYHNAKEGVEYPATLFMTADNDTRSYPLHSRKMTAMLQSINKKNKVLLFIETEAGHGVGKPKSKFIGSQSLVLAFFAEELGLPI